MRTHLIQLDLLHGHHHQYINMFFLDCDAAVSGRRWSWRHLPTLPYNLLRVINYAGDPHTPGSQIAATIWRQLQLLQALFCICSSVSAAWNPVSARKSKWTPLFQFCLLCRVCGWICVRLWRLTASRPVPQSGASQLLILALTKTRFRLIFAFLRRPQRDPIASYHFRTGTVWFLLYHVKGVRCVSGPAVPRRAHLSCAFTQHSLRMKKKNGPHHAEFLTLAPPTSNTGVVVRLRGEHPFFRAV